jgi:hypothetical protein
MADVRMTSPLSRSPQANGYRREDGVAALTFAIGERLQRDDDVAALTFATGERLQPFFSRNAFILGSSARAA